MYLQVIYEDNHLIALNKPAGILVQGDATGDVPLLDHAKHYIKQRYNKPGDVFLGTIHRIDRPVSGAVIFARTSKALSRMNALFQSREIQKTYLAISHKGAKMENGKIRHFITKDKSKNKAIAYDVAKKNAKEAITHYELLSRLNNAFLYKIKPITGRPHQIRVQMAKIGCPLLGDLKYGSTKKTTDYSIGLHCHSMEFIHPVKKEPIKIMAETPMVPWWRQYDLNDI